MQLKLQFDLFTATEMLFLSLFCFTAFLYNLPVHRGLVYRFCFITTFTSNHLLE